MSGWETGVRRYLLKRKYQLAQPLPSTPTQSPGATPLDPEFEQVCTRFREIFASCEDIVARRLDGGCLVLYCQGMVDSKEISEHLLSPLMHLAPDRLTHETVRNHAVSLGPISQAASYEDIVAGIMAGEVALILSRERDALMFGASKAKARAVEEPASEPAVRGPRDGFTEERMVNISLVRRRLRHPAFKTQTLYLGRLSQTPITLMWIEGVVQQGVLDELRSRLKRVDIDLILESAYIEEFVEEHPWSLLPTVNHTERPDRVTAMLAEGRVAIVVDNTPFVLIVPTLFTDFFQTAEDYYSNYLQATILRWVRIGGLIITMVLPSAYVALTAFHQEILPTQLLLSTAAAREGVPMPAVLEALTMQLVFEIVREAGVRMPRPVGSAVTIVGALVIGEAAVRAGLISAPMVIVVSLTALASFVLPSYSFMLAIRMISLAFILLAGVFGLLGILAGEIALLIHLCGLRSFGVSYMGPLAPPHPQAWKDTILRLPFFSMHKRAWMAADDQRTARGQKPAPPGVDPPLKGGKP